jgi:hypothetical protein
MRGCREAGVRIQNLSFQVAALAFLLASLSDSAVAADGTLLGSGKGVDHATLLTQSLVRTSRTFNDLGFTVSPVDSYDYGFENGTMYFADGTYLELFGVHDPETVAKGSEAHAAKGAEGLTWVTIDTSSIEDTTARLKLLGHQMFGPDTVPDPKSWWFKLSGLKRETLPGHRVYFIEYNQKWRDARRQRRLEAWQIKETHRNGAQGLRSVWVAVRNLADAEKLYRDSGFSIGRRVDLPHLHAVGREIATGERAIMLVEPAAISPAAAVVKARTAGFIGYSIRVRDLAKVRAILAENNLSHLAEYDGPYGRSLSVPPAKAGGSWLEFFE